MFNKTDFISHAGKKMEWKIECDDLTDDDLETLAYVVSKKLTFGSVYGIPRGGVRFAKMLERYCTEGGRLLVDDVFTTGMSMDAEHREGDAGLVIFSRGETPDWVTSIFKLNM